MRSDAVHQVLETELADARRRRGGEPPRVLDVGGGSGVWAVPLASAGCAVTVVDPSPNALATLQRRADDAGVADRITPLQGDTDALSALSPEGGADLVLAHGLLEVVDDVAAAVSALAAATAPGGVLSVLVANRYATIIARALAGRVSDALQLLQDADGRLDAASDTLQRRFDVDGLEQVLTAGGLKVELIQGQAVLSDLVPGSVLDNNPRAADEMAELERIAAVQPPLRDIATRLHAVARA
ncbi:class I SAM-dependent methyltransferase [Saccharopolyspora sp. WRP15-2]|uniref:Class I SAM-dependent methyltransferase n=1 Tax=Saccharopolyspora oryzae TaxID=2997343 RepID=A0ABT4UTG4_9PSEU|nr:class I SAM-dependent methyltransferase [Saccharopolyspora oryzae]MDA3624399.1 class I SAM-dependent methyltransferase [Saccharopolyspora oryzae]